jgi:hypothetical protein
MQVFFGREYQSYGDVTRQYAERLNASLRELELEIVEASAGSRDECELLYRKMVSAILVRSNVGSPTDITVVREATAALESVLPPIELGTFAALTTRAKETQLVELASIVTGIRLFNKSCGKGALLLSRDSRATLPLLTLTMFDCIPSTLRISSTLLPTTSVGVHSSWFPINVRGACVVRAYVVRAYVVRGA